MEMAAAWSVSAARARRALTLLAGWPRSFPASPTDPESVPLHPAERAIYESEFAPVSRHLLEHVDACLELMPEPAEN